MTKALRLGGLVLIVINFTGCATYWADRGRDALDIFTVAAVKGAGVSVRIGPLPLTWGRLEDVWGLQGGTLEDLEGVSVGCWPLFVLDTSMPPARDRGKQGISTIVMGFPAGGWPDPFIQTGPSYFEDIDVTAAVGGGLRIGLNPGELLDFLLGFTTLDIYKDDGFLAPTRYRGSVHCGRPIGNAIVTAVDRSGRLVSSAVTAADGTFVLRTHGRTVLKMEARAPGYRGSLYLAAQKTSTDLHIELTPQIEVRPAVIYQSRPNPSAMDVENVVQGVKNIIVYHTKTGKDSTSLNEYLRLGVITSSHLSAINSTRESLRVRWPDVNAVFWCFGADLPVVFAPGTPWSKPFLYVWVPASEVSEVELQGKGFEYKTHKSGALQGYLVHKSSEAKLLKDFAPCRVLSMSTFGPPSTGQVDGDFFVVIDRLSKGLPDGKNPTELP